ncbi:MAG: hydrogenase expression/formation protein HypE [Firmicutes bacterium]|nr:hydrogenase expression/formation protein HypE [Bacillota bacterium]MCL5040325.1 hydrogenase expression/formation protein HypE [Bacillota bacterium]
MEDRILLAHGDGGLLTHQLISELFLKYFRDETLKSLGDSAILPSLGEQLAFTTDSFVVQPPFFPGGDIGKLSICGTVNDLAVSGARPLYLSAGFILEEGLLLGDLEKLVASMAQTAQEAGVRLVAGDTKVVERGHGDKIFVTTSGVGQLVGRGLGTGQIRPGDLVLLNGPIGDHGMAVLSQRHGLEFEAQIRSDCAPLNGLTVPLLSRFATLRFMRDPTRGGLATTIKEIATASGRDILLLEKEIPVRQEVRWAAELLGLDPLYLANEGKVVIIVAPEEAAEVLNFLRGHPLGGMAAIIGRVLESGEEGIINIDRRREGRPHSPRGGQVYLETPLGARRLLDLLAGEQMPRIC